MATRIPRKKKINTATDNPPAFSDPAYGTTSAVPAQPDSLALEIPVLEAPTAAQIVSAITAAVAAARGMQTKAGTVTITDLATYRAADESLLDVRNAAKVVDEALAPIIKPLRATLDKFYEIRRMLDGPLEAAKNTIKARMGEWQIAEKIRLDQDIAANAEKGRQLEEEIRKQAMATAFTPEPVSQYSAPPPVPIQRVDPTQHHVHCMAVIAPGNPCNCQPQVPAFLPLPATPPPPPPMTVSYLGAPTAPAPSGHHSSVSWVKKVKITDATSVIDCVLAGIIPFDILTINESAIDRYLASNPDAVAKWPGIQVYDEPRIAGK